VDDATLVLSAFFKLCLHFDGDPEPLTDFRRSPRRVLQFVEFPGPYPPIERLEFAAHLRELLFKRIDRAGQARRLLLRGDQNHAYRCLMPFSFSRCPARTDMKRRPPGVPRGPSAHFVQRGATYA